MDFVRLTKQRMPVWMEKSDCWLFILKLATRRIEYSWALAVIQGLCLILGFYFYQAPPSSIGIAGICLAVVALVMTVRAEERWSRTERVFWFFLAIILAGVEIKAIKQDTIRRDEEEAAIRR